MLCQQPCPHLCWSEVHWAGGTGETWDLAQICLWHTRQYAHTLPTLTEGHNKDSHYLFFFFLLAAQFLFTPFVSPHTWIWKQSKWKQKAGISFKERSFSEYERIICDKVATDLPHSVQTFKIYQKVYLKTPSPTQSLQTSKCLLLTG